MAKREKSKILDGFRCPHPECGRLIRVDILPRVGRRKRSPRARKTV